MRPVDDETAIAEGNARLDELGDRPQLEPGLLEDPEAEKRSALETLGRQSDHLGDGERGIGEIQIGVGLPDPVRDRAGKLVITLLDLGRALLRQAMVGDVVIEAHDGGERARLIHHAAMPPREMAELAMDLEALRRGEFGLARRNPLEGLGDGGKRGHGYAHIASRRQAKERAAGLVGIGQTAIGRHDIDRQLRRP